MCGSWGDDQRGMRRWGLVGRGERLVGHDGVPRVRVLAASDRRRSCGSDAAADGDGCADECGVRGVHLASEGMTCEIAVA